MESFGLQSGYYAISVSHLQIEVVSQYHKSKEAS